MCCCGNSLSRYILQEPLHNSRSLELVWACWWCASTCCWEQICAKWEFLEFFLSLPQTPVCCHVGLSASQEPGVAFGLAFPKPWHEIVCSGALNVIILMLGMFSSSTDAFVNSQEWTLSRSVPELKVVSSCLLLSWKTSWKCHTQVGSSTLHLSYCWEKYRKQF